MKVREIMKQELDSLIKELLPKIEIPKDRPYLTVNNVFDLAAEAKIFNPVDYIYTEDINQLYELLTYSLGLTHIWVQYKNANPNAPLTDLNLCLITFMRNMWGLDKVWEGDDNSVLH